MSAFKKFIKVLTHRPWQLWQHARSVFLFSFCYFFRRLVIGKTIATGPNVRFQSLANFLTATEHSRIEIGAHSIIYENARLEAHGHGCITVGASSILGDVRIVSRSKIHLGERTLTSWNVFIQDFDPHPTSVALRAQQMELMTQDFFPHWGIKKSVSHLNWQPPSEEIWIGNDVWLGAGSVILKGTRIGSGSVVAAGAIVTGGNFAERSLIAGNPARFIKELHP